MKTGQWLLCYDIADPRRLARVHRIMQKEGIALQKSVFKLVVTEGRLSALVNQLTSEIDVQQDDIRIYRLHRNAGHHKLGKPAYPKGIMLFSNTTDLLH